MQKFGLAEISAAVSGEYRISGSSNDRYFQNLMSVFDSEEHSLVFISEERNDAVELIRQTRAQMIICGMSVVLPDDLHELKCLIHVDNPRLTFYRIGQAYFKQHPTFGIHPTAVIHPEARLHENTYIGPFSYIGKCIIGEGTILYGHTHLYDGVRIGKNVLIHAGCVLGADGFGYIRNEHNELENFPHFGGVVIEDDVEIGANTCIDRGSLGNTIIRQGAKIDNLVHIAHNVIVGRHSLIIANAMIGGSSVIEDYAWISPSSCIRDQIRIGHHTVIGMASVVTKNVPDNETWVGSPAQPLEKFITRERKLKEMSNQK